MKEMTLKPKSLISNLPTLMTCFLISMVEYMYYIYVYLYVLVYVFKVWKLIFSSLHSPNLFKTSTCINDVFLTSFYYKAMERKVVWRLKNGSHEVLGGRPDNG